MLCLEDAACSRIRPSGPALVGKCGAQCLRLYSGLPWELHQDPALVVRAHVVCVTLMNRKEGPSLASLPSAHQGLVADIKVWSLAFKVSATLQVKNSGQPQPPNARHTNPNNTVKIKAAQLLLENLLLLLTIGFQPGFLVPEAIPRATGTCEDGDLCTPGAVKSDR